MDKARIALGLREMSVSEKITFANTVIDRINNDPQFAGIIDASEVNSKRNKLKNQQTDRDSLKASAKAATELLKEKETEFDEAMVVLARNVENLARGVAAVMEAAGFMTYLPGKAPPVGLPVEVRDLFLTHGASGQILADWQPVTNALNYRVEVTKAPIFEPVWEEAGQPSASELTIGGLESGTKYWVRVAALGTAGQGPWSDPATLYAP